MLNLVNGRICIGDAGYAPRRVADLGKASKELADKGAGLSASRTSVQDYVSGLDNGGALLRREPHAAPRRNATASIT